ncbi:MAG: EI24 domain-containing protein [Minwuiales bacterium]|nr:EI24 domain-containing protein [Minwuiales bacterium]
MFSAFSRAFAQVFEGRFQSVLWRSLALTAAVFVALAWGLSALLPLIAVTEWAWLNTIIEVGAFGVFALVTFILFPAVATLFIGIFLDEIAEAVEQRHYPTDRPGSEVPFLRSIGQSLRFAAVVIGLNILVLPLYIVMIWLPPINILVFYGLNGYLLGREYFELVARRHVVESDVLALRRSYGRRLFLTGVVIAFLLTVPIVNLLAPIVATAAMVHVFKRTVRAGFGTG